MARPYKMGLDYFTVDTDLDSDPKIQRLIREGDTDAWTVYSWLWIKTYHDNYYIEKDTLISSIGWLFRSLTDDRICECLDILVKCKLIDKGLYEKGIITGKGIQRRYWEVAKNRSALPDMTYWLLEGEEFPLGKTTEKRSYDGSKPSYEAPKPRDSELSRVKKHETETERERETERETDNETETEDDVFVPSYSPTAALINKALESICYMDKDDYEWVAEAARFYPEEWLEEALNLTLKGKKEGKVRAPVMYMSSILERWFHENAEKSAEAEIDAREKELAEQKAEYMKPGKLTALLGGNA